MESKHSSQVGSIVAKSRRQPRSALVSGLVGICLAGALALPAYAADPATALPGVTVTSSRNPGETPVETAYGDTLAQRLEKFANYPTSREASVSCPSGTSAVWVTLSRPGKVVGHGLDHSSGSQILDQHAVELATRGKYAPLPTDAWTDGPKHRFVVSYKFDCPGKKPK